MDVMDCRVLLIIDSAGKTTKKWYVGAVKENLEYKHINLATKALVGVGLDWMYAMLKEHCEEFEYVVIVSCGNTICTDHLRIADIADILTQRFATHHLVMYGGASELWDNVEHNFEEMAVNIRNLFHFAGVLCIDGRTMYNKNAITRYDIGGANHFYGTSRYKAVSWLTDVVLEVFSATIRH